MNKNVFKAILAALLLIPLTSFGQLGIITIVNTTVKKVIRQIDLKVQKMQNKTIALQNAQKALENSLVKSRLQDIATWTEKQRRLYENYYAELREVKAVISTSSTARRIVGQQAAIISESRRAERIFSHGKLFTSEEVRHMRQVYSGLVKTSAQVISDLKMIAGPQQTQMGDSRRLELLSSLAGRMQKNLDDLRRFNNGNYYLGRQRLKRQLDIDHMRRLYNTQQNIRP